MSQRTIMLSNQQDELIGALLKSGRFASVADVLDEALRLVERQERDDAARRDALCEAAWVGIDAIERGEYREFSDFDELNTYLVALTDDVVADVSVANDRAFDDRVAASRND